MLIVAPYHLQENTSELFAVGSSLWFGCLSQSTHPVKKDGPSHVILSFFFGALREYFKKPEKVKIATFFGVKY